MKMQQEQWNNRKRRVDMTGKSCKGFCIFHPTYSRKLTGKNFRYNIDAYCSKCEKYFKNRKDLNCDCCGQRLRRRAKNVLNRSFLYEKAVR